MTVLAFDVTNSKPSIALFINKKLVDLSILDEKMRPAENLLLEIEQILQKNDVKYSDLKAIVTAKGPASFTSVRIGLSCAKSLAMALKIPVFSFDSLLAVAYKYYDYGDRVLVVNDAKMEEFFVAEFNFENSDLKIVTNSALRDFEDLQKINLADSVLVCGDGKKIVEKIAGEKGVELDLADDNDRFIADSLGFMYFDKKIRGDFAGSGEVEANYLRQPVIGQRKG